MAVGGRGHLVLFFEQFDEVRRVGEGALVADLRDRLRGRDQQQARVHEPLADEPFVRWNLEVAPKLLLEGGERAVRQSGELLDRDVAEDVVVDNLN